MGTSFSMPTESRITNLFWYTLQLQEKKFSPLSMQVTDPVLIIFQCMHPTLSLLTYVHDYISKNPLSSFLSTVPIFTDWRSIILVGDLY